MEVVLVIRLMPREYQENASAEIWGDLFKQNCGWSLQRISWLMFGPSSLKSTGGKKPRINPPQKFKSEFGSFAANIHSTRICARKNAFLSVVLLPQIVLARTAGPEICKFPHRSVLVKLLISSALHKLSPWTLLSSVSCKAWQKLLENEEW